MSRAATGKPQVGFTTKGVIGLQIWHDMEIYSICTEYEWNHMEYLGMRWNTVCIEPDGRFAESNGTNTESNGINTESNGISVESNGICTESYGRFVESYGICMEPYGICAES